MRLVDKVAIITGGASGIGRACAIVFAREGAKIVVADINDSGGKETVKIIKENGGEAVFVHIDVAVASEAENLIKVAQQKFSKIDILINSAAILPKHRPIEDWDEAEWDRVFAVNLKGALHTMQYTVPVMKKVRYGSIINIGGPGQNMPKPNCSAYASSKGALLSLTREVSLEIAQYKVRVNNLNPGGTDTPMQRQSQDEDGLDEADIEALVREMPFGRMIKPEEIAYAALFLASDEALMISGADININPPR